jgi:uncharacterized protein
MDKVQHFEIPADDMARAKKFYGVVFGWKTRDVPGMDYAMAITTETEEVQTPGSTMPYFRPKEPGVINGGIAKRVPMMKAPSTVISVADADEAVKKVEGAGGKLLKEKQKFGNIGYVAYIQDTEGNTVGIWQSQRQR